MPLMLTIKHIEGGQPGKVYYPLQLKQVPKPTPGPGELLVRMTAAALNHRDLFIRQHQYPGISFDHAMLADGSGTVEAVGPGCRASSAALLHRPVVLTPSRGWASSALGPEEDDEGRPRFAVVGSTLLYEAGTAVEYAAVPEDEVEPAPPHLSAVEAAALPLAGLTAWRALVTKAGVGGGGGGGGGAAATTLEEGQRNILVTGIGGGVALAALQFGVALGCRVYVTSGTEAKLARARALGAAGAVSYRDPRWDAALRAMLPAERPYLDAVVDGAGGDVVRRSVKLLKAGGVIACYGMTVAPTMDWVMQAVLKNIELKGTTMGSRAEFRDMVEFVREKKIRPVVSRVVRGLDNIQGIDGLFEDMKKGEQFGKLVIEIAPSVANDEAKPPSKI